MVIKQPTKVGSLECFKIFLIEKLVGQWLFLLSMAFDVEFYFF
jgi:hypothetical protein